MSRQQLEKEAIVLKTYQDRIIRTVFHNWEKMHPGRLFNMKIGSGKTYTALTIVKMAMRFFKVKRVLIIAPANICSAVWPESGKDLDLDIVRIANKDNIKWVKNTGIHICSYAFYQRYSETFNIYKYDLLILDESHRVAGRQSKTSKALVGRVYRGVRTGGINATRTFMFTGTPAPNKRMQFYPQLVLAGYRRSYTQFKDEFFTEGKEWYLLFFKKYKDLDFKRLVGDYSLTVDMDEVGLEVGEENIEIPFSMPKKIFNIQETLREHKYYKSKDKHECVVDYVGEKPLRFRELARGFISYKDGFCEELYRSPYKVLNDVLLHIGDKPVIIFFAFRKTRDLIMKYLNTKRDIFLYDGTVPQTERNNRINNFLKSADGIFLAQYQAACRGLNLQTGGCHNMIFFEMMNDAEIMTQAKGRIRRVGQVNDKCFYYYFKCRNSIDIPIQNALVHKTNVSQSVDSWLARRERDI